MNPLADERCQPCKADAPAVRPDEEDALIKQLPGWRILNGDTRKLEKTYTFTNFRNALSFTNAVGEIAERAGHHPALLTEWGKVTVTWWTHAINDLHRNDFILAAQTERIAPANG